MGNAIAQLKADHVRMRALFDELLGTSERGGKAREKLLEQLVRETKIHAQVEEEVFYPAFKEGAEARPDRHLFYKATESHHAADVVIAELMGVGAGEEHFLAKAELLRDMVLTHMKEEEQDMFARARQLFTGQQLARLGAAMDERRATLAAQWDNPVTRPMKKVQGLVQALLPSRVKNAKAGVLGKAARTRSGNGKRTGGARP
jgi:hypothetical protein